jgi:acetyl esterase/lipase|tara:strand:+ start:15238 stop:16089 length:852 start_codon:yes stop_codon:yes gene_type:complete
VIDQLVKAPPIGEARDQELLKEAHSFIYFHSPGGDLAAHFFFPPGHDPKSAEAPVILFLHGGMWDLSMPTQFVPHALHFATRGAVCMCIEYRVAAMGEGTPVDALEDAAMAMVFLRKNATILGIDPANVVFAGAGSGAHLALCCTTLPEIGKEPGENFRPSALFLFSPLVNTTRKGVGGGNFSSGEEAREYSPSEHLPQAGLPPCKLYHGRNDRLIPIELVTRFAKRYAKKKNSCELMEFEGAGHTFFNYNSHQQNYEITLRSVDCFLVDLGILEPDPLAGEF